MPFPINRPRRLRRTETIRRMVRETRLSADDLILPMFVCAGRGMKKAVASMPGVAQMSVDNVVAEARETWAAGVPAVILFGIPERKDAMGREAWNDDGEVQRAIREIKERVPGLTVITDVCMCEYTDHGHCGALSGNDVDNDATLELLTRSALSHARARARGRRYRRAVGHDGRARGRDSHGARQQRLQPRCDHGVFGQVRVRVLRAVSRGGGVGAEIRRSPLVPDGSAQRRRGDARSCTGPGRRGSTL